MKVQTFQALIVIYRRVNIVYIVRDVHQFNGHCLIPSDSCFIGSLNNYSLLPLHWEVHLPTLPQFFQFHHLLNYRCGFLSCQIINIRFLFYKSIGWGRYYCKCIFNHTVLIAKLIKSFPVWLRNRIKSAEILPVLRNTEKSYIVSY